MIKNLMSKKLMCRANLMVGVFSLGINVSSAVAATEVSAIVQEIMNTLASKGPEGTCKEGGVFRRTVIPPKGSKGVMPKAGGACLDLKIAAMALLTCSDYKDPDKKKTPFEQSGCGKISTQAFGGKNAYSRAKAFLSDGIRTKEQNVRAFVCQTPIHALNKDLTDLRKACTQSKEVAPGGMPLPIIVKKKPEPVMVDDLIETGIIQGKLRDLEKLESLPMDMAPIHFSSTSVSQLSQVLDENKRFLHDILVAAQGSSKDKTTKDAINRIKDINKIITKGKPEQISDLIIAVEGLSTSNNTLASLLLPGEALKPETIGKLNIKNEVSKFKTIDELMNLFLDLRIIFEVENKILSVFNKKKYYSPGIKDILDKAKEDITTLDDHGIGAIANELIVFSKASEQIHSPLSKAEIYKEIAELMTVVMVDYDLHEFSHNSSVARKETQKVLEEVHEWLLAKNFKLDVKNSTWEAPSETPTSEGEIEKTIEKQISASKLPQDTKQILEKLEHNKPVKSEEVLHLVEEADEQLSKAIELGLNLEFSHNEDEKKGIQKRIAEINQEIALLVNSASKKGIEKLKGSDQKNVSKSLTQIEKRMSKEGFTPDENEQYHPPHSTTPKIKPTSKAEVENEIEEHLAEPNQLSPEIKQILENLDHNKPVKSGDILDLVEETRNLVQQAKGDLGFLELAKTIDEPKDGIEKLEHHIVEIYDHIALLVNSVNNKGYGYLKGSDKETADHLLEHEIEAWMRNVGFTVDNNGQWVAPHSIIPLEHPLSEKDPLALSPSIEETIKNLEKRGNPDSAKIEEIIEKIKDLWDYSMQPSVNITKIDQEVSRLMSALSPYFMKQKPIGSFMGTETVNRNLEFEPQKVEYLRIGEELKKVGFKPAKGKWQPPSSTEMNVKPPEETKLEKIYQEEPKEMHDDREMSIKYLQEKFPNMTREEIEKVVDTTM